MVNAKDLTPSLVRDSVLSVDLIIYEGPLAIFGVDSPWKARTDEFLTVALLIGSSKKQQMIRLPSANGVWKPYPGLIIILSNRNAR